MVKVVITAQVEDGHPLPSDGRRCGLNHPR